MPSKAKLTPVKPATAPVAVGLCRSSGAALVGKPTELLLLKWGRNETAEGLFIVNERTLACLTANQRLLRREEVYGDFEHASVPENPEDHPMPFASKGTPEVRRGIGLLAARVEWLKGSTEVPDPYGDLSAAPIYDEATREVIGLHSYAHCRHGAADGATIADSLRAGLQKLNARVATLSKSLLQTPTPTASQPHMNPETELLCSLYALLGITCPENPTAEQLAAAAEEAKAKLASKPGDAAAMAELSAKLTKLSADVETLRSETKQATKLAEMQAMIEEACGLGKLIMLSAKQLLALENEEKGSAKAYLESLPEGAVPISSMVPAKLSRTPGLAGRRDPQEIQALRDQGFSEAEIAEMK